MVNDVGFGKELTDADKSMLSDMDLLPEDRPKKRGRPPGSKNASTGERKPRETKSYYNAIVEFIQVPNSILRSIPVTSADALLDEEVHHLAMGLDFQQKNSPVFRKRLLRVIESTGSVFLATVCVGIALRVASNHQLLPPQMMQTIQDRMKAMQDNQPEEERAVFMQSMMNQGNVETG